MAKVEIRRERPLGAKFEQFRQLLVQQCDERAAAGRTPRDRVHSLLCEGVRDGQRLMLGGSGYLSEEAIRSARRFAEHIGEQRSNGSTEVVLKLPSSRDRARHGVLLYPTVIKEREVRKVTIGS